MFFSAHVAFSFGDFTTVFCLSFVEQKRCDPPEWAMIRLVHIVVFLRLLLLYERLYTRPKEGLFRGQCIHLRRLQCVSLLTFPARFSTSHITSSVRRSGQVFLGLGCAFGIEVNATKLVEKPHVTRQLLTTLFLSHSEAKLQSSAKVGIGKNVQYFAPLLVFGLPRNPFLSNVLKALKTSRQQNSYPKNHQKK